MNDSADQADAVCEHHLRLALAAHQDALRDVAQVCSGGDVLCADCGEAVDPERVAALPGCVRCIDCQKKQERVDTLWR